jgi:phage-related minor tail protein
VIGMPVEVGVGYVSIVPETRGFGRQLQQQITGESAQAGTVAGGEAGDGFLGGLGGKLKAGVAGVAAVGGALFAAGFAQAVEEDKSNARLSASLGLSEKESARAGKIAGKVYGAGYGESIDQVNDSLKSLQQNGVAALKAPQRQLAGLSKSALNLAEVFDADVADSTKAVGQLMRTGLVKNAKAGFDLLTAGFQSGADKAGDLIDTVNEYSTQWRKAGFTGATAIGLINQGLKAGARDGDLVADTVKEFSVRAVDGSALTAQGFKALGLDADKMAAGFAKGGKAANGVLALTLDRLRGIKDPVKQSQAAVALFGTQAEDLGASLYSLDPTTAAAGLGKVGGAADKMGKQLHSAASSDIDTFKRQALQGLANVAAKYALPALRDTGRFLNQYVLPPAKTVSGVLVNVLVPAVKGTASALATGAKWVKTYGIWLVPLAIAVGGVALAMNASAIATGIAMGVMAAYSIGVRGVMAVTRAWTAAQALFNAVMALNPITLIVIGVLALAAAAVIAFKKVGWFHDLVITAWNGIKAGWDVLWNSALKPGFEYLKIGLQAIGSAASWLWSTVLSPTFSAIATAGKILFTVLAVVVITPIMLYLKLLGAVAGWLWNNAIGPAFKGIVALAGWWWSGVKLYFGLVKTGFSLVGQAGLWLYRNAIQPVFRGIVTLASWWWTGVKLYFGLVKTGLRTVGDAGTWLYRMAIKPAFDGIVSAGSWLWSKGLKPAFDNVKRGVGLVGSAFGTAKDAIGKAFGKIESITKKPVNFVIDMVYTHGIKAVWDKVAGFVGLGKLPAGPKLLAAGGTVGPWGPAAPMRVNRPTAIVGEGDPRYPEYVIPTDPRYRKRALALHAQAGTRLMADGGVIGDVADWLGDKAKSIGSAVMNGVDFLANPGKLWNKATEFVRTRIGQIGRSPVAQMVGKVPLKMLSSLKDKVVKAATSVFGGGDSGAHGASASAAQAIARGMLSAYGWGPDQMSSLVPLWNGESGWNYRAENASSGAYGIPQALPASKMASAGSDWRTNPATQIRWGLGYIRSRYGSPAAAWAFWNRQSPHWYARGTSGAAPGWAWVGERGPELVRFGGGETVLPHRDSLRAAGSLGALGGYAKGTTASKARKEVPGDLSSFTKSLTGSASTIAAAAKALAEDLKKTGTAGKALASQVTAASTKLQALAKQRDAVASKIATAKQAAADQKKNAQDYLSLTSLGDVSSVGDLISGMQSRQTSLKSSESLIKLAQKKGVSQSVIRQLVAAGPDSNLAQLVSGASAGDIKKINSLAKSGAKLSTGYGNYLADAMYDSGKNAGAGFLTGLQSQEKALQAQMKKLGDTLVDEIEDRLEIHSPSRVTEQVGAQVGAGIVVGTDKTLAAVRSGAQRLATAAIPAVVPAAAAAQSAAGGLQAGDTLVLRVGEDEFTAVVDKRVDAGLDAVRRRSRAGSKKG